MRKVAAALSLLLVISSALGGEAARPGRETSVRRHGNTFAAPAMDVQGDDGRSGEALEGGYEDGDEEDERGRGYDDGESSSTRDLLGSTRRRRSSRTSTRTSRTSRREREKQRDRRSRTFSKGYLRTHPGAGTRRQRGERKRAPRNPSWMRGAPMQKIDLPPSEDPLPGPICRNKNTTKCKAHSNPYLNGNLQMLSRKELYAMSYESSPNNPYKKPKTGPVVKCADVSDCKHLGKLCVDGQCVCPVMYSGSYDCTVETKPKFSWCAGAMTNSKILKLITDCPLCRRQYLFEHLWVRHTITGRNAERTKEDLVDMADFSTCAVVGSGQVRNKGAEINNHTAIIRCNDGPTRKYESKVGKRTTVRIQNRDYAGWMEKRTEICLPYTLGNITKRQAYTWNRFKRCQGVFPSKLALNYFKYYWDLNKPRGGTDNMIRKGVQTSAGFSAILFAMHVCGKVSMYGFNQGVGHYYRKPHVNDTNRKKWGGRHHWNFEKRCLNLMRQGKVDGVKVK